MCRGEAESVVGIIREDVSWVEAFSEKTVDSVRRIRREDGRDKGQSQWE